jgi:6-phosphofructokinase 1
MKYIIDTLPGSKRIGKSMGDAEGLLSRYRDCRIIFSYAREDWPFVERVAQALQAYFPQKKAFKIEVGDKTRELPNVFCYTTQGNPFQWVPREDNESQDHYSMRNEAAAGRCYKQLLQTANVFVLFTYKKLIKAGTPKLPGVGRWQEGELHAWNQLSDPEGNRTQYMVDFERAHGELRRSSPHWASAQSALLSFEDDSSRRSAFISVDAYDLYSVRLTAERILRHLLFDQDPSVPPPTDTMFSYEKPIVQVYKEICDIIGEWDTAPSNSAHKDHVVKLLAYIKQGVPPYWPSVSRQADFMHTRENPLVDIDGVSSDGNLIAIGSPRKGLDMLWPTDAQERARVETSSEPDMVVAAALSKYHRRGNCRACMLDEGLAFPEAGPRKHIYASAPEQVCIVVSGGIAPGINAVIDGIVRRQKQYSSTTEVLGVNHGFFGLTEWDDSLIKKLSPDETSRWTTEGGSCLKTCRLKDLLPGDPDRDEQIRTIVETLAKRKIKILYVIGGDGTMRAAHYLAQACRQQQNRISVVAIPKTMDNDILWVWQSFGFATAVEKARETIEHLATEVEANPRICVLQLFGSASGFVVSHAVLASRTGTCDFALIPEAEFSIDTLAWKLAIKIAKEKRTIPFGLVVMAESAIPSTESCTKYGPEVGLTTSENSALQAYLTYRQQHDERFPDGQITNSLRSASLKLVSEGLRRRVLEIFTDPKLNEKLRREVGVMALPKVFVGDEERFRVFTNEPRHLLRSVPPSFSDVIMGNRLGALAVDNAMAGYTGFMISQWLTEFVMVPLDLVALGRKHIPQDGIFWKSVLAKTGQGHLQ